MSAGRGTVLAIASAALHLAFFAIVSALPEPQRVRSLDEGELIEVVHWSDDGAAARPAEPPAGAPTTTASSPAPPPASEPIAKPAIQSARVPKASRPVVAQVPARTDQPTATEAPAAMPPGDAPPSRALALHGLRERSTAQAQVTSPRFSPGALGPRSNEPAPAGPPQAPQPAPADDALPRSLAEAGFSRNRKGEQIYRAPGKQFSAILLPDGRLRFKDHMVTASAQDNFAPRMAGLPELVRKHVQQRELWAHDKALLSRRTFELRLAIAVAFAETQIEHRLKTLYRDLLEIWQVDLPAATRRITVFDRWDECDESMRVKLPGFEGATDTRIDALRKSAGDRARDTITAFVRRQAPKGSADAYTTEELESLNRRRRSKARFAPYDATASAAE